MEEDELLIERWRRRKEKKEKASVSRDSKDWFQTEEMYGLLT